jgi:hypothetical protein
MKIKVEVSDTEDLATKYLLALQAIHKMKGQQFDLMVMIITEYLNYKEKISDNDIIFSLIFSTKSKQKYREKLNVSPQRFQNLMSALRKKKILTKDGFNTLLAPNPIKDNISIEYHFIKK